jgi:hypothetical protein
MILAVAGGVIGIAALVAAYLTWSSWSAKTAAVEGDEESDGLDAVVAKAEKLSRSPVYPCAESVKATGESAAKLADWMADARRLAARGDRVFEKTTPPAFKTFLVQDAKRLVALPGSVSGALAQPDFAFGPFKGYIAGGDLPSEAQLAELQRRWDDVATVTEILASCGICELVDVQFKSAEKPPEENAKDARGNRKNAKKPAKKGAKAQQAADGAKPVASFSYVFSFTARPAAFVKAVNAFETCERFVSVDDFSFRREKDAIAEAFGGDEKKAEAAQAGGRRRRRGGAAPSPLVEEKVDEAKSGIVTDPQMDSPFVVTMTVTVHDFRSLEDGDKTGEEAK